jgi:hypothetical protein
MGKIEFIVGKLNKWAMWKSYTFRAKVALTSPCVNDQFKTLTSALTCYFSLNKQSSH